MQSMYPDIYHQLLTYVEYGVRVPKYGHIEAKAFGTVKGPQVLSTNSYLRSSGINIYQ